MSEEAPRREGRRRGRSRRRRLIWAAGTVAVLVTAVIVLALWALGTERGAGWTFARLGTLIPGELEIGDSEGPIRGPLVLHDVHWQNEKIDVVIERLEVDWNLPRLLAGVIDFEWLRAFDVDVVLQPSEEESDGLTDMNLRFNLLVRELLVEDLEVHREGQESPFRIDRLVADSASWGDRVEITRFDLDSPDLELEVGGSLRPVGDYEVDLEVAWAYEGGEVPRVAGEGTLTGTLVDLVVDQTLREPFPARVTGRLHDPLFDLRLDVEATFRELRPRLFADGAPEMVAAGTVAAAGALDDLAARGELDLDTADYGELAAAFALERRGETWEVERLRLTRPGTETTVTAAGTIELAGDASRVAAELSWQALPWPLTGDATLSSREGRATVRGTLADYTVTGRLALDGPDVPAGTWTVEGRGDRESFAASRLSGDTLGGTVAGTGRVRWQPDVTWGVDLRGEGVALGREWDLPEGLAGPASWRIAGTGDTGRMEVDRVVTDLLGGSLSGAGSVRWDPSLSWTFAGRGQGLDLSGVVEALPEELRNAEDVTIEARGTAESATVARLEGAAFGGQVDVSGEVRWQPDLAWSVSGTTAGVNPARFVPQLPPELGVGSEWAFDVSGTDARADVRRLEGRILGGDVRASGDVSWDPRVAWDLVVDAAGIDPETAWPQWPGDLAFTAETSGVLEEAGPSGTADVTEIRGTLRGEPIAGEARVAFAGGTYRFAPLQVTWGGTRIDASGAVGAEFDLTFAAEEVDLSRFLPDARGVLTASGRVVGLGATPRITATLTGDDLVIRGYAVSSLSGEVDVDLAPGGTIDVDLVARDVLAGGRLFAEVAVAATGVREAHRLEIVVDDPDLQVQAAFEGGLTRPEGAWTWQGEVAELGIAAPRVGRWQLTERAPLLLSTTEVDLADLCLADDGAELCASGAWIADGPLDLRASLEDLPLAVFEPFLDPEVRLTGDVDGNLILGTDAAGQLVGEIEVHPGPGSMLFSSSRGEDVRLRFSEGDVLVRFYPDGVVGDLDWRFENDGAIVGHVELPGFAPGRPPGSQPISGTLLARFGDLSWVEALVPDLGATSGSLAADVDLSGTLQAPRVAGEARLEEGSALVPVLGIRLTDVSLVAAGGDAGPLRITGQATSGEGVLTIAGEAPLGWNADDPLRVTLSGDRVLVYDVEDSRVLATPRLELTHTGEAFRVTGEVTIPEARLVWEGEGGAGAVETSPDVVYVGPPPPTAEEPGLEIFARVRVLLGDDVTFSAKGLETGVEGALLLVDQPGQPVRATGDLYLVDGTFEAYGQDLTLERSRLSFAGGPVTNPALAIRAYREARDGTIAGVEVRGTVSAPEVRVWAEPTMSESDALAYLLFGRPLQPADTLSAAGEGDLVGKAVDALGLKAGSLLAERLGRELGIEEASLETEGAFEEARLVLGTYLSPRLFVGYGIGIFDGRNTFRIRYEINDKWTLRAESGGETSADVVYEIERGYPRPGDLPGTEEEPLDSPDSIEELAPVPVPSEALEPEEDDEEDEGDEDGGGGGASDS